MNQTVITSGMATPYESVHDKLEKARVLLATKGKEIKELRTEVFRLRNELHSKRKK